jgi:hypothetical protein
VRGLLGTESDVKQNSQRMVLGVIGGLLGAGALAAYLFHARGVWAVSKYTKELEAKGEKLTVDEVLPKAVPPDHNSIGLWRSAMRHWWTNAYVLQTNLPQAMHAVAPGKAVIAWKQPDIRGDGTNTWEQLEADLEKQSNSLASLEAIINRPMLDFYLDYKQGYTLLLPHLAPLKQASVRLNAAALSELRRGDTARAARRIRATLALVKATEDERCVISQLVRMAMTHLALAANWELLQAPTLADADLAQLQQDWMGLEFMQASENALLLERALNQELAEQMRNSSSQFRTTMGSWGTRSSGSGGGWLDRVGQTASDKTKETLWRYAWSYPDQLQSLKGLQAILESMRMLREGKTFKEALDYENKRLDALGIRHLARDRDEPLFLGGPDPRFLFTQGVLAVQRVPVRLLSVEAGREMVVTAIALKRYQLSYGEYPTQLAALAPAFIPATPHDPVDGQALRYRRNADGSFLLYSIGDDGVDNGGDPNCATNSKVVSWQRGRDFVWPSPATEKEIQAAEEKNRSK